jgi:putative redox protein
MAGKSRTEIRAVWQGGLAYEASNEAGLKITMDSPLAEGTPKGPAPMQVLLMGLAACTAMDATSILEKKRQDVTGLEVKVVGKRAEDHPRYFTEIEMEFVVRGREIDPKAVERAIELSAEKYCSASANLQPKSEISYRFRIEQEESQAPEQDGA